MITCCILFLLRAHLADICASFQEALVEVLVDKCFRALNRTGANVLALGGGVACNARLREAADQRCRAAGPTFSVPARSLCADNAAMIAAAGAFRLGRGERSSWELTAESRLELPR